MKYSVFSGMLIGPRARQEDCLMDGVDIYQSDGMTSRKTIETSHLLVCVCDGMGGHDHGNKASRFVCEEMQRRINPFAVSHETAFSPANIDKTFADIQTVSQTALPPNCGTTVAGLMISGDGAVAFNAGDSRVYRISGDQMAYLSHDHSLVQELVDQSFIPMDTAATHPFKNMINFGIGPLFRPAWRDFAVYVHEEPLSSGACFLLCSDGLSDILPARRMLDILSPDPLENGGHLLKAAQETGLKDNTSVIIVKVH